MCSRCAQDVLSMCYTPDMVGGNIAAAYGAEGHDEADLDDVRSLCIVVWCCPGQELSWASRSFAYFFDRMLESGIRAGLRDGFA